MDRLSLHKRKAHRFIEDSADELTDFLSTILSVKSVNPNRALPGEESGTGELQRLVYSRLQSWEIFDDVSYVQADEAERNVVASFPATQPSKYQALMLNGHIDVVPVTREQTADWVGGDPWRAYRCGEYLYGRGAADMKGAIAAMVWASRSIAASGVTPPGRFTLALTVGEESGDADLGPFAVLDAGYRPDLVVVGEPTNLDVCPAAVGWFFFQIEVSGMGAHAAARSQDIYPKSQAPEGTNAIDIFTTILSRMSELERQWGLYKAHPLMPPGTMTINPVQISGGDLQATTPDYCSGIFAVTVAPGIDCTDALKEIEDVVNSLCVGNPWLSANPPTITAPVLQGFFPSVAPSTSSHATKVLLKAAREIHEQADLSLFPSPSDANFFNQREFETIVFGPGRLSGDGVHGKNERIRINDVIKAAKAYASFILEWCSTPK